MRILIFRHVPFEGAGRIEALLRTRNIDFDYVDLYQDAAAVPDAASCQGLIFLGGPMSVNDDVRYLRVEEQIIRDAIVARVPVLGICLGAQLLARAMGAAVRRNPRRIRTWRDAASRRSRSACRCSSTTCC